MIEFIKAEGRVVVKEVEKRRSEEMVVKRGEEYVNVFLNFEFYYTA